MHVLVTGGAGYIGSHAALRLLEHGHSVSVLDDLSRGHRAAIDVLAGVGDLTFVEGSLNDAARVDAGLRGVDLVMHFAAKAYVGESVEQPLDYYRANVAGSLALLEGMERAGVTKLVFSSTCATYGEPAAEHIPMTESCPQRPINPYGRSKLMIEQIVADYAAMKHARGEPFAWAALRYFNVAGCDGSGRLGEDHRPETHLVPICLEAALGQRPGLTIHGNDYDTPDGTCVRDYVHVEDLIDAHLAVIKVLEPGTAHAYNVGIGRGYSVREVMEACRRVTGVDFPVETGPRRPGDPPALYADASRIRDALGWRAAIDGIDAIIGSAWNWKQSHPDGYA